MKKISSLRGSLKDSKGFKPSSLRLKAARFLRLTTQLLVFTFINGKVLGLEPIPLPVPFLQPGATPTSIVISSFEALQRQLTAAIFPFTPLAAIILSSAFLGRLPCSWACPFGLLQDLTSLASGKKVKVSLPTHRGALKVKYGLLAIILFLTVSLGLAKHYGVGRDYEAFLGVFASAPFEALSPSTTFFALFPHMILWEAYPKGLEELIKINPIIIIRFTILIAIILGASYIPRFFCRYLCPLGALIGFLGLHSLIDLKRNMVRCVKCRTCEENCPTQIRILERPPEGFKTAECIKCLECKFACPNKAIEIKIP